MYAWRASSETAPNDKYDNGDTSNHGCRHARAATDTLAYRPVPRPGGHRLYVIMIAPLYGTLQLSLFRVFDRQAVFVGLDNFRTLFGDPRWSASFWNALWNNCWFFIIHMLVQTRSACCLPPVVQSRLSFGAFYRTAIFVPTILSFVIVGFVWKLILSRCGAWRRICSISSA